ncbi:MAG: hypothetical protein LBT16_01110 [Treponema sp.]|jgi:hypothetical protein|nr:hypothetical protein [Treponema sp.]
MRRNGLHTAALLGAVLTSLLLAACQNEGRWYPGAEVSVQSSYEFAPGPGAKAILVTLIIHNTSSTTINTGVVTLKVTTDRREYFQTASTATAIIPGGKVALPVTVPYLDSAEQVAAGGVTVYDSYFN